MLLEGVFVCVYGELLRLGLVVGTFGLRAGMRVSLMADWMRGCELAAYCQVVVKIVWW